MRVIYSISVRLMMRMNCCMETQIFPSCWSLLHQSHKTRQPRKPLLGGSSTWLKWNLHTGYYWLGRMEPWKSILYQNVDWPSLFVMYPVAPEFLQITWKLYLWLFQTAHHVSLKHFFKTKILIMNHFSAPEITVSQIQELMIAPLGHLGNRPLLFVRLEDEFLVYQAFHYPRGSPMPLRFRRLQHSMLTRERKPK